MEKSYRETANILVDRIYELILKYPEILKFENAWELFSLEEFKVADLSPSFAQASVALLRAKERYNEWEFS